MGILRMVDDGGLRKEADIRKGMYNVTHSVYELAEYIHAQGGNAKRAKGLVLLIEMGKHQVNKGTKELEVPVADHAIFIQEAKSG